jgi:hypothetical protein
MWQTAAEDRQVLGLADLRAARPQDDVLRTMHELPSAGMDILPVPRRQPMRNACRRHPDGVLHQVGRRDDD